MGVIKQMQLEQEDRERAERVKHGVACPECLTWFSYDDYLAWVDGDVCDECAFYRRMEEDD